MNDFFFEKEIYSSSNLNNTFKKGLLCDFMDKNALNIKQSFKFFSFILLGS